MKYRITRPKARQPGAFPVTEVRVRDARDCIEALSSRPMGGQIRGGKGLKIRGGKIEELYPVNTLWLKRRYHTSSLNAILTRLQREIESSGSVRLPMPELEAEICPKGIADEDWRKRRLRKMGKGKWVMKAVLTDKPSGASDYAKTTRAIEEALLSVEIDGLPAIKRVKDIELKKDNEEVTIPVDVGDKMAKLEGKKLSDKKSEILKAVQDAFKEVVVEEGVLRVDYILSFAPQD